jgi:hypothetical protein
MNGFGGSVDKLIGDITDKFNKQSIKIDEVSSQAAKALIEVASLKERFDKKDNQDDGEDEDRKRRKPAAPSHASGFGPHPGGSWVPPTPPATGNPFPTSSPAGEQASSSAGPGPSDQHTGGPRAATRSDTPNPPIDKNKSGNGCKVWVKGFGRPCRKETLELETNNLVHNVNIESMEDYEPAIKGYDLEQVCSIVFDTKAMADSFIKRYNDMDKHIWTNPDKQPMELRVVRDSTFDERMRRQILWLLKDGLKKVLINKNKWDKWPEDKFKMADTGNRGAIFISTDHDIHELIKVNLSKRGESSFIVINRDTMTKYHITAEQADKVVADSISAATLLLKKV